MSSPGEPVRGTIDDPPYERERDQSSVGGKLAAVAGVILSVIYLANLTAGFVELPDNLPIIGNLDEVFFSGLLIASLHKLGIRIVPNVPSLRPRKP